MRLTSKICLAAAALLVAAPFAAMRPGAASEAILTVSGSHPAAVTVDLDLATQMIWQVRRLEVE